MAVTWCYLLAHRHLALGKQIPGLLLLHHWLWKWLASVRNSGPYSGVDTSTSFHLLSVAMCLLPWGGGMVFQLWIVLLEPTQESKADLVHAKLLTHHLPLQRWRREEFTPGKMYVLSRSDQLQSKPPFSVCSIIERQHSQECLDIAEQIHYESLIHRPLEKVLHHLAKLLTYHPQSQCFFCLPRCRFSCGSQLSCGYLGDYSQWCRVKLEFVRVH